MKSVTGYHKSERMSKNQEYRLYFCWKGVYKTHFFASNPES